MNEVVCPSPRGTHSSSTSSRGSATRSKHQGVAARRRALVAGHAARAGEVQRLLELLAVSGLPSARARRRGGGGRAGRALRLRRAAARGAPGKDERRQARHAHRITTTVCASRCSPTSESGGARTLARAARGGARRVKSDDAETLSVHWHGAGDAARAATYAERAADTASRTFAFERAARLYRSALEMAPHSRRPLDRASSAAWPSRS